MYKSNSMLTLYINIFVSSIIYFIGQYLFKISNGLSLRIIFSILLIIFQLAPIDYVEVY